MSDDAAPKTDPGAREGSGDSFTVAPDRFPLGRPPFRDVEAAARLLIEYRKKGMSEETGEQFAMLCYDFDAVLTRAAELEAAARSEGEDDGT